jgi:hypothetical protein
MRAIFAGTAVLALISGSALGQTMPTRPSSSATIPTLPTERTKPNSLCVPTEFEPCSSENQPAGSSVNTPPNTRANGHAFTADQAKSQIEAGGYSAVTELQRDVHGNWRGKAVKNGQPVRVTLDFNGNLSN